MVNIRSIIALLLIVCLVLVISVEGFGKGTEAGNDEIKELMSNGSNRDYANLVVENPIIINNSTINGKIRCTNCTFNYLEYRNCTFKDDVLFDQKSKFNNVSFYLSKFKKNVAFDTCKFIGMSNFNNVKIDGNANFNSSEFIPKDVADSADFSNAEFRGNTQFLDCSFSNVKFANAKFHGKSTDFRRAKFLNYTLFWSEFDTNADFTGSFFRNGSSFFQVVFPEKVSFANCTFGGKSDFSFCNFTNETTFENSRFHNGAYFSYCEFGGSRTDFSRSTFSSDTADFQNSKFENVADFSNAVFNDKASFYFAEFSKDALFENTKFNILNLNKTKYDKLYINWRNINKLEFNQTAYQALIDNFKKLGFLNDANEAYYAFRKDDVSNTPNDAFTNFVQTLALYTYGFGVKPLRALAWSLGLIIFFAYIWSYIKTGKLWLISWLTSSLKSSSLKSGLIRLKSGLGSILSHSGEDLGCSGSDQLSRPECSEPNYYLSTDNPLIFSIAIFLSGTKFFIDPPTIPESMQKISLGTAKSVFIVERALGAIFSVLFIIALSRSIVGSA
jgi:hypothetical protein